MLASQNVMSSYKTMHTIVLAKGPTHAIILCSLRDTWRCPRSRSRSGCIPGIMLNSSGQRSICGVHPKQNSYQAFFLLLLPRVRCFPCLRSDSQRRRAWVSRRVEQTFYDFLWNKSANAFSHVDFNITWQSSKTPKHKVQQSGSRTVSRVTLKRPSGSGSPNISSSRHSQCQPRNKIPVGDKRKLS